MITCEIMDAIHMMGDLAKDDYEEAVIREIAFMLEDFVEYDWNNMTEEQKKDWLESYM